jgi:hypothetical protein
MAAAPTSCLYRSQPVSLRCSAGTVHVQGQSWVQGQGWLSVLHRRRPQAVLRGRRPGPTGSACLGTPAPCPPNYAVGTVSFWSRFLTRPALGLRIRIPSEASRAAPTATVGVRKSLAGGKVTNLTNGGRTC